MKLSILKLLYYYAYFSCVVFVSIHCQPLFGIVVSSYCLHTLVGCVIVFVSTHWRPVFGSCKCVGCVCLHTLCLSPHTGDLLSGLITTISTKENSALPPINHNSLISPQAVVDKHPKMLRQSQIPKLSIRLAQETLAKK